MIADKLKKKISSAPAMPPVGNEGVITGMGGMGM